MADSDEPKRPRVRSILPRLLLWAGIVALVIALGAGADMYMGRRDAEAALARIRARGEPTSVKEIAFDQGVPASDIAERTKRLDELDERSPLSLFDLEGPYSLVDDPASWPEWRGAVDTLTRFAECWNALHPDPPTSDWTVEIMSLAQDPRRLDRLSDCERLGIEALGALAEPTVGIAMDVCAVSRETGEALARAWKPDGFSIPNEELRGPVLASFKLYGSIPALLLKGEVRTAMARIEAGLHATNSIRGIPWLAAHLFWTNGLRIGLNECREVTASQGHDVDWSAIERELSGMDPRANLRRALMGERAFCIEIFQSETSGGLDDDILFADHSILFPLTRMLNRSHDFALFLEAFEEGIANAQGSTWDPNPGSLDWQRGTASFPTWARCTSQLLPDFANDRMEATWMEADLRLARVAIAAFGRGAPAGLEVAATSVDPFDGRPLRARLDGGVLVIWSVGPDLVDDGGLDELAAGKKYARFHARKDDVWRVRVR